MMTPTTRDALPAFLADRVLPSHDSLDVKRAILNDLLSATGASIAALYTIIRRPDELVLRAFGIHVIGDNPTFAAALMAFEGMPVGPYATVSALHPVAQFEVSYPEDMPPALVEAVWAPANIHSAVGINLLDDDGSHVAWVGAFSHGDAPHLPRALGARLASRVLPYRDLLIAANRMDEGGPGEATLVMDQSGTVVLASSQAANWLKMQGFKASLMRDLITLHNARAEQRQTHFRSALVTITAVSGRIGQAYVVTVCPQRAMTYPKLFTLTRPQRRVAELAGEGQTITDIAQQLGRSAETVRFHLRRVYAVLGISTRAELALVLRENA